MKNRVNRAILLLLACTLITACAKTEEPSIDQQREKAFEAWVELYGEGAEKIATGVYVKKLRESTIPGAVQPSKDSWVMINHTGRELTSGNVYLTRDSTIAKHQGRFTNYTNYIPQFVPFQANSSLYYASTIATPNGYFLALKDMKEGDLWRLYLSSEMAYGDTGYSAPYSGFGGQNALGALLPVVVDLELTKVVPKPSDFEANQVRQYASSVMKLGLGDTLAKDVYYKQTINTTTPTVLGAKLGKDSTLRYYYVGRFLNGFVFDTNIKDTAEKYNLTQYKFSSYQLSGYKVGTASDAEGAIIKGLDTAFYAMHYGETGQVIMSSENGYGSDGRFPSEKGTIIPPYSPLIFDIEVAPRYGNGTRKYPYMVEAIQHMTSDEQGVWVMGYVAGVVTGSSISESELRFDPPTKIKTNILLSNTNGVTDYKVTYPILLPEGPIRDRLNLIDNPSNFYTKVNIKGDVGTVFGVRGLTNVIEYSFGE